MKKLIGLSAVVLLLITGGSSCTKCYVCKDKTSSTLTKVKYCDKDFDKGDVDAAMRAAEDDGYSCHAESVLL